RRTPGARRPLCSRHQQSLGGGNGGVVVRVAAIPRWTPAASPVSPSWRRAISVTASRTTRSRTALPILGLAALGACVVGMLLGAVPFSPGAVFAALRDPGAPDAAIMRDLRLP